jgi:hypothetical protein
LPGEFTGRVLDSDDMGASFEFLINPFEHIGSLEMVVVLSG